MANKQTQAPEAAIESALSKGEQFIEKNGKKLLTSLIVVVALIGVVFGYNNFYKQPFMESAATSMNAAQHRFQVDSFAQALNGVNGDYGFLAIAEEFSGTPQANIANHYAGICYLNMGEYQQAITYLTQYKSVKGSLADVVSAQNLGLIGDAYVEIDEVETALQYYVDAAAFSDNMDTAPKYLQKAAMLNLELANYAAAIAQFESIKRDYPNTSHASNVDKYIAYATQKNDGK